MPLLPDPSADVHPDTGVDADGESDPDVRSEVRVAQVSETELLDQIFPLLPHFEGTLVGPGDDAAVISAPDGRVVVSTDVLVEDQHFRSDWSSGYDVGWRAAVQNLADIAAMGAEPTALVMALVLRTDLPVSWVLDLARGLRDACAPWGVGVVGGDLSAGQKCSVAVTVHGDLGGRDPVLRSGARPGDLVAHAGVRGRSAAGFDLLSAGCGGSAPELVEAFLRPLSPLEAGPAAQRAGATAMLDVSDGLVKDAGRIARASGVTLWLGDPLEVFADEIEVLTPAALALADPDEELRQRFSSVKPDADPTTRARNWVLTGGEDHGLLATFPAGVALPAPFRVIGSVLARAQQDVVVEHGAPGGAAGWDHFERT